jgi:hypothetical protein
MLGAHLQSASCMSPCNVKASWPGTVAPFLSFLSQIKKQQLSCVGDLEWQQLKHLS